jgi:hypothetical protein
LGFSSLALTPKEGIPAFLIKFQDCDPKLRLLSFLELTGALGEALRDGKYFKIREKFSYTIINYPADFHLYYCIVEQKCKNNITGRNKRNIPLTFFQNELMRRNNEFTYEV